ncbi:branched-chain amino acid ABC transporter permease [Noviherbaspirillum sp.]|uniref:branched-chain amino acid ABC transporter permease n=1 Tax=Noviherbaspirillum sp. TaxID=1926288 RepID=UPI002D4FE7FA|nr:branched-chain amino acid ABC transporter permease [Noviherbaspirillum sp.]HZW19997.1 branched-chain amino acid ABC transporter permease [Noviherbaspirillum sp.]
MQTLNTPASLAVAPAPAITRQRAWMAASLLAFGAFPFISSEYWLYWACLIAINVISATGLNILAGYTGLASLGQAAFMGVGAYCVALLEMHAGTPFLLNIVIAGAAAALIGLVVGIPSLRVKGLYLAISTIAASIILEFTFANWDSVTNGVRGLNIAPASLFGTELARPEQLYWIIIPVAVVMVAAAANLFRTRVGRAFIAIRDRDISAEVLGIPLLRYKLMSFGLSSFYAGVAGGLWAYFFRVVTPESFPIQMSIFFLAAIIVGGMGSISGSIIGAAFMTMVPEMLRLAFNVIAPADAITIIPAIRAIVFGTLIIGFLLFEPQGLAEVIPRLRKHWRARRGRGNLGSTTSKT